MNKKIVLALSSLICLSSCNKTSDTIFSLPEGGIDYRATTREIADEFYDNAFCGLIKCYSELRDGGSIEFNLNQFDVDYDANVIDEMNGVEKDFSIDISKTSVNVKLQANFANGSGPFQALAEVHNLKNKTVIVDDDKKNEFNVKSCSFSAYVDNSTIYLDLSDPNVKDTLSAPLFFIINDVLQYKIKASQISTLLALLKGKNAIGGLSVPEIGLPYLDATDFWDFKDELSALNLVDNEDRTFIQRYYDDNSFGHQIYSKANALNDSFGYDLTTDEGEDYSLFNDNSYSNLIFLYDREARLVNVLCNLNIDYSSKYFYNFISDSGDEFIYSSDISMKFKTSFSIGIDYGSQNIGFPDFSSYNFVDLSSFFS